MRFDTTIRVKTTVLEYGLLVRQLLQLNRKSEMRFYIKNVTRCAFDTEFRCAAQGKWA